MTRREAREEIIRLLFETEFRSDETPEAIYATSAENREIPENEYVKRAYFGICENKDRIDSLIGEHSNGWKTNRLSHVSRAVLRLAVYEMLFEKDIPFAATINEAVELTKQYDDEKARPFVNGVLNSVKNSLGGRA